MKRVFALFLTLLLISSAPVMPVFAEFKNPPVVDEAGYLTVEELTELSETFERIRLKYDCEVAVYIEEEMSGYNAESSADDIYDYQGYGAGLNADGILLYLCSDTREYHFTTCGYGMTAFNERGLVYLEKQVLPYLQENDYAGAFSVYSETVEDLLEMASQGTPYNEKQYSLASVLLIAAGALIVPFITAKIMTNKKLNQMNTAVKQEAAANYMKPDSRKISVSRDLFLYSTVTKSEKAKSGSGTHTSSSGRTHGGRGGTY